MVRRIKIIALLLFCFIAALISCRKATLPLKDYLRYVSNPENGLVKEKKIQDFKITLSYLPAGYLAIKEIKNKELSLEEYKSVFNKYQNHHYFNLRVENITGSNSPVRKDVSGYPEYAQKLDYLSFYGQNDMKIVVNSDTVECALYHFENNYRLLPFNDIQMAFKSNQVSVSDIEFIWNDVVIGVGKVKFTIEINDYKNIPEPIL